MRDLDPDDPRPPYEQLADVLRSAIQSGELAPGDRLPSRAELTDRYGVAGATIASALRLLRDEGLIVSRQGSGVFVRSGGVAPVDVRAELTELKARIARLEEILDGVDGGQEP